MPKTEVIQTGNKSLYFEQNTGQITIHSPQGEIIINPLQAGDIDLLKKEFGEYFQEVKDLLAGLQAKSSILQHLGQIPFMPEVFLGREKELQDIHTQLFSAGDHVLMLVNGEGGQGKTSLASQYYHRNTNQYAHLAWVLSQNSIAGALLELAPSLGVHFDEQEGEAGRMQQLLQALANLPRPCLLVIDNANELQDLEVNYQRLRQLPNFHLLLTTRITNFQQAATYRIEGLPEDDAIELFHRYYPQFQPETEKNLLLDIRRAVGGNTLVLELLAKNLALLNTGLKTRYPLERLLEDLRDKGVLKLTHREQVATDYGALHRETPEAIIAAMYKLGDLPPEEAGLLAFFAVLPAENIPYTILQRILPDRQDLDRPLLALAQKGWIEYNPDTSGFKCSPVVQEVTRLNAPGLQESCRPLLLALIRELDNEVIHQDNYQHSALFVRYAAAAATVLNEPDDDLATLFQNIGNYHVATGDLSKAMAAFQSMADIQSALFAAHPDESAFKNGLAISYEKLGDTHTALGNLQKALTFFEERSNLGKELYEAYPQNVAFKNGLAISYSKLGSTHTALGNLQKALTFFEERSNLGKELYEAYPQNVAFKNGLAISYEKLGDTHTALGNLQKALTFFEDETSLFVELYEAYPQNVAFKNGLAISYSKLGETHTALGNLQKALTFFEDETSLFVELYEAYPQNVAFKNGLAISYEKLGETHTALGNLQKALTFFEDETSLFVELYEAYPQNVAFKNGLAISYEKLGETHTALGNLQKALTFFEDETSLFVELYEAYPQNVAFKNGLAISYYKLGEMPGDTFQSRQYFQQAAALWQELVHDAPQYAQFQQFLSIVQRKLEDLAAPKSPDQNP